MSLDLIAALPLPIVVLDPDGGVALVNTAAETFLNVSRQALLDRGLAAALEPSSAMMILIGEARLSGNHLTAYDGELQLASGRAVRADVFVTPLADAGGGTMISFQTRHPLALLDRTRLNDGAVRAAIGVAAMLAHEIKNPLSGIRGAAQLLGQNAHRAGDVDAIELTTLIRSEVDRVVALIDRMEGFTDTRPVTIEPCNIHGVLGQVRQIAVSGFADKVAIREHYDPSLPAVAGNHDALVQVFLNLVKNAAEAVIAAGGQGGAITLTTAYRHGFRVAVEGSNSRVALPLEICVIDTGDGPPSGVARRMFDPFVTSKRSGGGLGLALVAKTIADHGGVVEFERASQPPRTIFRVLLPVAA